MEPNLNMSLVYRNKIYTYVQLYGVWTGREELADFFFFFSETVRWEKRATVKFVDVRELNLNIFFYRRKHIVKLFEFLSELVVFNYTVCFFFKY